MSFNLWRLLLEDDADGFRTFLAKASFDRSASRTTSYPSGATTLKVGSPGALSTSPKTPTRSKRGGGNILGSGQRGAGPVLTRADINGKDAFGRTLLHHAASSQRESAIEFVRALLEVPFLDLYAQDTESGWTALHRALYFGNVSIAQALMLKDIQNATDYTTSSSHVQAGGLVKIKDHEGNSPFEVFALTIASRSIQESGTGLLDSGDAESAVSVDMNEEFKTGDRFKRQIQPIIDLQGDEVFAFGSNRNLTLGTGDEDDRHFPERIQLTRPKHLQRHLFDCLMEERNRQGINEESVTDTIDTDDAAGLPAVVVNKPLKIQNVVMSKLHTAILTDDPISNLHICGFGPGGRLGIGDESTRFTYVCVQGGGLAKKCIATIALGQDHSIAVCTTGEVFTWGSNKYGQLGYELPEASSKESPIQLTPRQIYGLIKKEQIIGASASSLHSAIYTTSALYTFGKNEGQLGLMDADARSLEVQIIPRRVGVSILQHTIHSVSAIDRATVVLLENHDVIVFTHYGWTKIVFPLEATSNNFISHALTTRYNMEINYIQMIATGGNTICAKSSYGEVFTIDVPRVSETVPSNKSTTNPAKARNSLPAPVRVWSIRKSHMAAIDAAVGQDGSIILCTVPGTVWKKEKRANIKSVYHGSKTDIKTKDYKFVRIPNITRATAVRSNAFGAFIAIRKDSDVTREQILAQPATLWKDIFSLLCFHEYGNSPRDDESSSNPELRFWRPRTKHSCTALIKTALITKENAEDEIFTMMRGLSSDISSGYDAWVGSNVTNVSLPVHTFLLKGRSRVLRRAMAEFEETYYFAIPDILSIEYGSDGLVRLNFAGADFLTIANLVLYLYTDTIADVWQYTSKMVHLAPRYRSVRQELMKIASHLELRHLERAVRVMFDPVPSMKIDLENAFQDSDFYSNADVVIDLAEGEERYAHTKLLCARCPFFESLFHGRTGGMWMANRRQTKEGAQDLPRVDLRHIDSEVFELVLRHIYADTGEELFDGLITKDLDSLIDIVIDVMSVANELMLERLAQICQRLIGQFVNTRNVCSLVNTIAESSVDEFKRAALEYLCLNLESMLEQKLLEELDDYLLGELDEVVRQNQLAYMPFARSERALHALVEQYPGLLEELDQSKQRRLDSMRLQTRFVDDEIRLALKSKVRVEDDMPFSMDNDNSGPGVASHGGQAISDSPGRDRWEHQRPPLTRMTSSEAGVRTLGTETTSSSFGAVSRISGSFEEISTPTSSTTKGWSTSLPRPEKMDLKHIMDQTSSAKVSSLTQSLQSAAQSVSKASVRVSQKERKRQQQQARAELDVLPQLSKKSSNNEVQSPLSPWQKVSHQSESSSYPSVYSPVELQKTRSPATKPLVSPSQESRSKAPSLPSRSVSTPNKPTGPTMVAPQIQSIRHTPLSVRSSSAVDARTSMADILAQQQTEKSAIREAVAKRSLQEIQQEQEFQEWWDQESRRVQEEQAASATTARRDKPGKDRRRGGGRRAKPNNKPQSSEGQSSREEQKGIATATREHRESHGSGFGRGSHRRGRGRGQAPVSGSTA